jgi:exodeoxyribonuclease VII small subunit
MTNNNPQNFETSLEELERIVRELERGDLPLEKSLELFEQGVKLSRACQERLNEAERRIEILTRDNQGRPTIRPFDVEKDLAGTLEDDAEGAREAGGRK